MTQKELFRGVIDVMKVVDVVPADLDYVLGSDLDADYTFHTRDVWDASTFDFGESEGVYIDFAVMVRDDKGIKKIPIGTAKTLSTDLAAMQRMGEFLGAFKYYIVRYLNVHLKELI